MHISLIAGVYRIEKITPSFPPSCVRPKRKKEKGKEKEKITKKKLI